MPSRFLATTRNRVSTYCNETRETIQYFFFNFIYLAGRLNKVCVTAMIYTGYYYSKYRCVLCVPLYTMHNSRLCITKMADHLDDGTPNKGND